MARDIPGTSGNNLSVGDPAALDFSGTTISLAAWVRPDTLPAFATYISKFDSGLNNNSWMLRTGSDGTTLEMFIGDGGAGFGWANGPASMTTGSWQHVAGTVGGGNGFAYRNGTAGSSASLGTFGATNEPVTFGCMDGINHMDGLIAEIGIWDVELTAAEVAALAKGFSPLMIRPQSLKGYWPLLGNASPEPDPRNGNNATVNGTVNKADHPLIIMPSQALYTP